MFKWFSNNDVGIFFSTVPKVGIRYILPSDSKEICDSKKNYPFINKRDLIVELVDFKQDKRYSFTIPKGFCYDGASIPRFFWRIIGSNTDNNFMIAALIHDVLCENHNYVGNDRAFSSKVFNALLEAAKVGRFKRFLMKNSVDLFQRFCRWEKKNGKTQAFG